MEKFVVKLKKYRVIKSVTTGCAAVTAATKK